MKKFILSVMLLVVLNATGQNININDYVPVPTPEWSEPLYVTGHENLLIRYEPATGLETVVDPDSFSENTNEHESDPYLPSEGSFTGEEPLQNDNFNNCEYIENTGSYHVSTCVKLFISFPDGYKVVGSGIMVGRCVVLTAGHCVYDKNHGGWAANVTATPGFNDNYEPFGNAYSHYVYSWSGWTQSSSYDWDIGMVKLNRPIGNQSGTLGYGYNPDDNFFRNNTFHFLSYPGESPFNGQKMYYCYGKYDEVKTHILYYNRPCWGGSSGGGIYNKNANGNRYVYAVHSHTMGNKAGQTRITKDKFEWIDRIVNETCPAGTGVDNFSTDMKPTFKISPNPATNKINISFAGICHNGSIQVFDLLGNTVIQLTGQDLNDQITLSIANLKPGYYFVSLNDGKNVTTQSFIKTL